MSGEGCQYYCENNECFLIKSAKGQAANGGAAAKVRSAEGKGSGPFWVKDTWNGYTQRSIEMATEVNCNHSAQVAETFKELTQEKKKQGEFI